MLHRKSHFGKDSGTGERFILVSPRLKFTGQLQMASLSFYSQFETIQLLLQLKSSKAHGKNYIKVKPHLVRHLLRNRLLWDTFNFHKCSIDKLQ